MGKSLVDTGISGLSERFLRARRQRALLTALGVAVGVALIVAMTILGATLQASITEQLRQGFGTYDVMAGYHNDRLMQPEEQAQIYQLKDVRYAVGILWLATHAPQTRDLGMTYNYIGIGEFPGNEFAYPMKEGRRPRPAEFVAEPRLVEKLGLRVGDSITLPFRTGPQTLTLSGVVKSAAKESSDSLILNLAWLQQHMKLEGQVTLQVLGLHKGARKDIVGANLLIKLPELDVQLRTELDEVIENMGGLKPMAIAFGIAGLFAAVFLVTGSFHTAMHERSRELALLRALGATDRQVMSLVLREAALLGALGAAAGVAIGALGAVAALSTTAASVDVSEHPPVFPWLYLALEWGGGVVLAVLAARQPARAAGQIAPLQAMRPDHQRDSRLEKAGSRAGLVVMGFGAALMAVSALLEESTGLRALLGALGGLAVAAGLIMALPRLLPPVVGGLARLLERLWPAEAILAGRSVLRHRRRSAQTASTLVLGIMLLTSVTTVFVELGSNQEKWVRSQFAAAAQVETTDMRGIDPELKARIAKVDGVTGVASRGDTIHGDLPDKSSAFLIPVDLSELSRIYDLGRVEGALTGGLVLTRELAGQEGLKPGDTLTFTPDKHTAAAALRGLPQEAREYRVTGVVDRLPFFANAFAVDPSLFPAEPDTMVYFNYAPGRRAAVKDAVLGLLRQPGLGMATLRDLGDALAESDQMLKQRWAILGAVAVVILVISLFGLVNSVVTGLHQRKRELAALRAVGSTPAQTRRQVLLETGLLGMAGSLLGLLAGAAFTGGVMVALGMTPDMSYPFWLYGACLLAGPLLAALASVGPSAGVSRGSVATALQAE